jgi:hypothetical protein
MPDECSDLQQEANKAADAYFPVMTEWATQGAKDERLRKEARTRAGAFRRSLNFLVDCYEQARDSIRTRPKLNNAVQMQHLVENDIKNLNHYSPKADNN